jgi:hypothetical protein
MPVIAEFVWTPPEGTEPTIFRVELFETHEAQIRVAETDEVFVHSPRWDEAAERLVTWSGYGPPFLSDVGPRLELFSAASDALRIQMSAVPID